MKILAIILLGLGAILALMGSPFLGITFILIGAIVLIIQARSKK